MQEHPRAVSMALNSTRFSYANQSSTEQWQTALDFIASKTFSNQSFLTQVYLTPAQELGQKTVKRVVASHNLGAFPSNSVTLFSNQVYQ